MKKTKICSKCKLPKELDEFGNNKTKKDGLQNSCKSCIREEQIKCYNKDKNKYFIRIKNQQQRTSNFVDEYRKNNPCCKCGENRFWLLDFHHKDPKTKLFDVGFLRSKGLMTKIINEIKKCIVLCKNCHSDFHYLEREEGITLKQYLNNKS